VVFDASRLVRLREQLEGFAMAWLDRGEVAHVEGDHDLRADSLAQRDHAGVGTTDRKGCVGLDELCDPVEVLWDWAFDVDRPEAT
jgi:hypothetical protein